MILYHGSISNFRNIDVRISKKSGDFGRGFYLAVGKHHAISAGLKKLNRGTGEVYLYTYEYTANNLNCIYFKNADIAWLKFIVSNRYKDTLKSDVVIGATADAYINETVRFILQRGIENFNDYELEQLIGSIQPNRYSTQYCFKTKKSVNFLKLRYVHKLIYRNYTLVSTIQQPL